MSDALVAAKEQEDRDRLPFILPQEFRIEYVPQPDGSQKPVEWVAWIKKGAQNPSVTEEKVARLQKYPGNPIWQVLKPYYERWKAGQESPVEGTPLAAWPGATPQFVKALVPANIRSVEDLALMEDSAIQKIGIPNLRDKQKQARAFLEAQKSTAGVAAENAKLREQVEFQAKELAEMRAALEALAEKQNIQIVDENAPVKRGPGRPRKNPEEQAA